ncbi:hypothetical protein D3C86_1217220 [compost metagenome]
MSSESRLSDRIRPGAEAAPWVVEAVKELETHLALLLANQGAPVVWVRASYLTAKGLGYFDASARRFSPTQIPLYLSTPHALLPGQAQVPLTLLERALRADASIGANAIQLADGWAAMAEIRILLRNETKERHHEL